jgi:hypothetical protein
MTTRVLGANMLLGANGAPFRRRLLKLKYSPKTISKIYTILFHKLRCFFGAHDRWCHHIITYVKAGEEKAPMKVVGVFYKAHEFAKDPKFLGCMENALGLREWLVSKGHTFIATDDKEGESCGKSQIAFAPLSFFIQEIL